MTHELKALFEQGLKNQLRGIQSVLATVVALEGSSYRKPGVRMLINSDGSITGAVSGGCVEKEIQRRAQSVFKEQKAKLITYDGRYRLGCEGILYILLEPFTPSQEALQHFLASVQRRETFEIHSYFHRKDNCTGTFGSEIHLGDKRYSFYPSFTKTSDSYEQFQQEFAPLFHLVIIGGEHDAVKLCKQALLLGWEVSVLCSIKDPKSVKDFPGATTVTPITPELADFSIVSKNTAIVLMNHNFTYDLRYLTQLYGTTPAYLGILGAAKRRERLFDELFNLVPDVSDEFLDRIFTPAGLHLGAITPEEIALSIVAEILSVIRNTVVYSLKKTTGNIHTSS